MNPYTLFLLLPKKAKFLSGFANDNLKSQADLVWRQLSGLSTWMILTAFVLGLLFACLYYKPYNESPGRHYRISKWAIWGIVSVVLTFIATLAFEYLGIKTNLRTGLTSLYWLCALNNALYCAAVYFLTSVVWCNFGKTNAYRFLKF